MTRPTLAAALIDVGGTLWPDGWPWAPDDRELRADRLRRALPGLRSADTVGLLQALDESAGSLTEALEQDLDRYVGEPLRRLGFDATAGEVAATVDAMCLPAAPWLQLFPGASELLRAVRRAGLACVIVSNAFWRGADAYRRDFADLGVAGDVDVIVSSVDVGFRKPHPAMFETAMAAVGASPAACAMVGNTESKDVRPARQLGMRTIRVAIEEPEPASSEADAVTGSLEEVTRLLVTWARGPGR
ncbi:MAG TPA: HAD family hydrolase [Actinomycetes bacterium]|jgi:HAD superfamily hydrolase (TIGR01509 family)|nr:HAD family hydrolase [Actinomycetes bacterium]